MILALGHMFIMHVLVELTGDEINFAFVQSRWGSPFWRIYDFALLVLAFAHGVNGARIVVGDYVTHRTAAQPASSACSLVIAGIWLRARAWRSSSSSTRDASRRRGRSRDARHRPSAIPPTRVHEMDAVVVGAGGAGLYAALELKQELGPEARVGVISKLYPSAPIPVRPRVACAPPSATPRRTTGSGTGSTPSRAATTWSTRTRREVMCHDAVETIINLEHLGLPFDRTDEGLINQRRFGGHTRNYGEGPVRRSCFAADRTGHAILQTLFQQCIKHDVTFFDEYQVLDLALPDGPARPGRRRHRPADGDDASSTPSGRGPCCSRPAATARSSRSPRNAHTLTGDGMAIPYRRGLPLEDMEFFQFHPTGMYKLGFLLSEAMRGEGGFLVNDAGERFMERYAPTMKDLASRDVVSRSIYLEIAEGRGIGGKDYVHLDVRHLGAEVLNKKLPDMSGFIRTYFGLEPLTDLVPIQPTAHYAMGGIPTDIDGRVLADADGDDRARASTRRARSPASASTGRTGSGRTRCSTSSSSAAAPGKRMAADLADLPEATADLEAEASVQSRVSALLAARMVSVRPSSEPSSRRSCSASAGCTARSSS